MAIQIIETNGTYEISGKINSENISSLKSYFDLIFKLNKKVTLDIEKMTHVDSNTLLFFKGLYKKAVTNNKIISIVGNKNITNTFNLGGALN